MQQKRGCLKSVFDVIQNGSEESQYTDYQYFDFFIDSSFLPRLRDRMTLFRQPLYNF